MPPEMANAAERRSVRMTAETLADINRLARDLGIGQAEVLAGLVYLFRSLKVEGDETRTQAARAYAMGLAPSWTRRMAQESFRMAVKNLTAKGPRT
jgi:hypothetical protein